MSKKYRDILFSQLMDGERELTAARGFTHVY